MCQHMNKQFIPSSHIYNNNWECIKSFLLLIVNTKEGLAAWTGPFAPMWYGVWIPSRYLMKLFAKVSCLPRIVGFGRRPQLRAPSAMWVLEGTMLSDEEREICCFNLTIFRVILQKRATLKIYFSVLSTVWFVGYSTPIMWCFQKNWTFHLFICGVYFPPIMLLKSFLFVNILLIVFLGVLRRFTFL